MSEQRGGPIGIALTKEVFRMANRQGVRYVEPNIGAMTAIARLLGVIEPHEPLPSQMLVVRTSEKLRGEQAWDDTVPRSLKSHAKFSYIFAAFVGDTGSIDFARRQVANLARIAGARALTEVAIPNWEASTQVFATAYARGLLQGQRPLDLLPEGVAPTPSDPPRLQRGPVLPVAEDLLMLEQISKSSTVPNPFCIG